MKNSIQSEAIEKHICTLRHSFISPQRLQHVIINLFNLFVVKHKPLLPNLYIANIMSKISPISDMSHHSDEPIHNFFKPNILIFFIQLIFIIVWGDVIIGLDFYFVRERN